MDPRIAARRIEVARAAGRSRLRRLLVALAIVAVLGAAVGGLFSPLLDVDRFDVRGADDRVADVVVASGIAMGAPLLLTDTGAAERAIGALPWVGAVRVERAFPGAIRIVVQASVPVAWAYATDGSVVYLDARGRPQVLSGAEQGESTGAPTGAPTGDPGVVAPPADPATLPELVVAPGDLGGRVSPMVLRASRVAASLGPLAGRVAAITIADGTAILRLHVGPEVRLGRVTRLSEKARAASAVLGAAGIEDAAYIDVSVPVAPVTG